MNQKQLGEIAEAAVLFQLLSFDLCVLKPHGDNQPFDFVIWNKDKFFKIQVKSGKLKDGCVVFRPTRVRWNKGKFIRKDYSEDEVDYFIIYCHDNKNYYIVKH